MVGVDARRSAMLLAVGGNVSVEIERDIASRRRRRCATRRARLDAQRCSCGRYVINALMSEPKSDIVESLHVGF